VATEGTETLWRRALIQRQNGNHQAATEALAQIARVEPSAKVFAAMAREFRDLDDIPSAYWSYRSALECSESDIDALSGLATLHGEQERYDDAVLVYFNVLKYHPQNVEGLVNLGNALARVDRHDEAEACYYGALRVGKTSPHRARIYYNLARSHAYAGRRDEAVHMLICAGHVNGEYAMRACLDDAFEDARVSPEFTKVLEFGERPLYKHIYGFVDRGQVDELRETFRQNPYLVTVVRTRPVFARFAEFLPGA
jgi:tetratricopeptide (TPR) repeat protein